MVEPPQTHGVHYIVHYEGKAAARRGRKASGLLKETVSFER